MHVFVEGLDDKRTADIRAAFRRRTGVQLHFADSYATWLNQVEIWLAKIDRDFVAGKVLTRHAELRHKVMHSLRATEKRAQGLRWSVSAYTPGFHGTRRLTTEPAQPSLPNPAYFASYRFELPVAVVEHGEAAVGFAADAAGRAPWFHPCSRSSAPRRCARRRLPPNGEPARDPRGPATDLTVRQASGFPPFFAPLFMIATRGFSACTIAGGPDGADP